MNDSKAPLELLLDCLLNSRKQKVSGFSAYYHVSSREGDLGNLQVVLNKSFLLRLKTPCAINELSTKTDTYRVKTCFFYLKFKS